MKAVLQAHYFRAPSGPAPGLLAGSVLQCARKEPPANSRRSKRLPWLASQLLHPKDCLSFRCTRSNCRCLELFGRRLVVCFLLLAAQQWAFAQHPELRLLHLLHETFSHAQPEGLSHCLAWSCRRNLEPYATAQTQACGLGLEKKQPVDVARVDFLLVAFFFSRLVRRARGGRGREGARHAYCLVPKQRLPSMA